MLSLMSKIMTRRQEPPEDSACALETQTTSTTTKVPAQAEFLRIVLPADRSHDDNCIAIVSLRTRCPLVGLYAVSENGIETGELLHTSNGRAIDSEVFLPPRASAIAIRNATNDSVIHDLQVSSVRYEPFRRNIDTPTGHCQTPAGETDTNIFIHTFGKTGSISLAETLHKTERATVSRDHFVNLPYLSQSTHWYAREILMKLNSASLRRKRITYSLFNDFTERSFVVCGVRAPLAQVISMIFQTKGDIFMSLKVPQEIITKIVLSNIPEQMQISEFWWNREFMKLHGTDLDAIEATVRRNKHIYELDRGSHEYPVLFYRIEDGNIAIRDVMFRILGDFGGDIFNSNTSHTKPYRDAYLSVQKALETYAVDWSSYPTLARISRIFGYAT